MSLKEDCIVTQSSQEEGAHGTDHVSYVVDTCKTPRPTLRVYLGFSVCPLAFSFHFVWYCFSIYSQIVLCHLKLLMFNGGKELKKKKNQNPICSCLRVRHSQQEEKGSRGS